MPMPQVRRTPKIVKTPSMTLLELLQRTTRARREASRRVAIKSLRRVSPPKGLDNWSAHVAGIFSKDTKQQYVCHVFSPDTNPAASSAVVVQCSCEDYVFTYEVANAKKVGAAFIFRSNGEDPGTRNPGMKVGLCKHSYLVLRSLLKTNQGRSK